jgi:thymidylate synthase (FAD)
LIECCVVVYGMNKGHTIKVLDHGFVRYIDHLGSDERICEAARISYRAPSKGPEQDKKLIAYLWSHQHTSPFEQINITFDVKLPLFVQGQMVRHRTQRLNQVSARYTEMVDEFYIPKKWRKQDTKNKQGSIVENNIDHEEQSTALENTCREIYGIYQGMLNQGIARELARMILPQNLYTEIYSNWDLNNLMRFFNLRMDEHAQWEIRQYAKAMYDITKEVYPWTMEAYDRYKIKIVDLEAK